MQRSESRAPKRVFRPYLGYVLNSVGAGMVSGGVVHLPLNENYYGGLSVAGALVFTVGALLTEIFNGRKLGNPLRVLFLVTTSLMLSFGIGMLSGGIQHFTDFPARATALIPSGLVLSFFAFCLKNETFRKGLMKKSMVGGLVILALSTGSYFALGSLAASLEPSGHTHGETEEVLETQTPMTEKPDESSTPAPEETSGDGHTDHNH